MGLVRFDSSLVGKGCTVREYEYGRYDGVYYRLRPGELLECLSLDGVWQQHSGGEGYRCWADREPLEALDLAVVVLRRRGYLR